MILKAIPNGDGSHWGYQFFCPGCERTHMVPTTGPNAWGFNGSLEAPTFTPSILVYPRGYLDGTIRRMTPRCHSNITDGRIQFHGDCEHEMATLCVALPEIPSRVDSTP